MSRIITLLKNYRITDVSQIQLITFWITFAFFGVVLFYMIWKF